MLALSALAGCATRETTAPRVTDTPPAPDSPRNTLLALKWALEHRDLALARTLFTADFVFVFAEHDSAGNAFRDTPWTREDELIAYQHLLVGGGTEPPADRIALEFTSTPIDFPSSRPGHDPAVHREIRAEMSLRVTRGESTIEVRGPGVFFFVRGDSAAIPQDLIDEGVGPDSTRWWIERWEDETVSTAASPAARAPRPTRAMASSQFSWGTIKAMYR